MFDTIKKRIDLSSRFCKCPSVVQGLLLSVAFLGKVLMQDLLLSFSQSDLVNLKSLPKKQQCSHSINWVTLEVSSQSCLLHLFWLFLQSTNAEEPWGLSSHVPAVAGQIQDYNTSEWLSNQQSSYLEQDARSVKAPLWARLSWTPVLIKALLSLSLLSFLVIF